MCHPFFYTWPSKNTDRFGKEVGGGRMWLLQNIIASGGVSLVGRNKEDCNLWLDVNESQSTTAQRSKRFSFGRLLTIVQLNVFSSDVFTHFCSKSHKRLIILSVSLYRRMCEHIFIPAADGRGMLSSRHRLITTQAALGGLCLLACLPTFYLVRSSKLVFRDFAVLWSLYLLASLAALQPARSSPFVKSPYYGVHSY